jgi:hypothetical protein
MKEELAHWNSDHCIDPESVSGVLFSNQGLRNNPEPSYPDVTLLATDE